jgi:hypothetical protein
VKKAERLAGRHCLICDKPGGAPVTEALRAAGFKIPGNERGYAHPDCVIKLRAVIGRLSKRQEARIAEYNAEKETRKVR